MSKISSCKLKVSFVINFESLRGLGWVTVFSDLCKTTVEYY